MSKKRDSLVYLDDILKSVNLILDYIKDKNESDLELSQAFQDAILLRFEIIGEAAIQLPRTFREKHKQIPWREMISMRNKIIHEYFGLNWYIIWKTVHEDLPVLKEQMSEIIKAYEYEEKE